MTCGPINRVASYAIAARYSNGKKKGEGNTKNGNACLVWAFIEAANFARRFARTRGGTNVSLGRKHARAVAHQRMPLIQMGDRHDAVVANR